MNNFYIIISCLAILFSLVALGVGVAALALVIGLKNSTHQVVWKPIEPEEKQEDPFVSFDEEIKDMENPNKRIPKEEPFADLSDPAVTSNNW
jgi:hypothetical protein